jgi:hypothetical protein
VHKFDSCRGHPLMQCLDQDELENKGAGVLLQCRLLDLSTAAG